MDRNAAFLVWAFNDHTGNTRLFALNFDEFAHFKVFKKQVPEILSVCIPAAIPSTVNLKAHADWIYFITH